jgi:DNA-directed RNA polymerase specialized sigma24 family protein
MSFPVTRHSVILAAASADPDARRRAFSSIVEAYWKPVYKYVRLKWHAAADEAEDLTQAFFTRAFEKSFFTSYDPGKARFRTFLRTCLDGFVANERKAAQRLKRGGGVHLVPLDFQTAEGELRQHDVAVPADMEAFFDHEWARSIFGLAVDRLRSHYASTGRAAYFVVFERYDLEASASGERVTYGDLSRELHLRPTDVTNYLAAARRQFRAFVLDRLRELTATDEEFSAEARRLLGVDV